MPGEMDALIVNSVIRSESGSNKFFFVSKRDKSSEIRNVFGVYGSAIIVSSWKA